MNNREAELRSLMEVEKVYKSLYLQEWNKKLSIYASMLFSMDTDDFIDFMTGSMAYILGFSASMIAISPPDLFGNVCVDPAILTHEAMIFAGTAIFLGALHMRYRYDDYNKYAIESANRSIEYYGAMKLKTETKRFTLFPESNKSYVTSAIESARKFIGI